MNKENGYDWFEGFLGKLEELYPAGLSKEGRSRHHSIILTLNDDGSDDKFLAVNVVQEETNSIFYIDKEDVEQDPMIAVEDIQKIIEGKQA